MNNKELQQLYIDEFGEYPTTRIDTIGPGLNVEVYTKHFVEWLMHRCCAWSRAMDGDR